MQIIGIFANFPLPPVSRLSSSIHRGKTFRFPTRPLFRTLSGMKKRLCLFSIPAALFAAQLPLDAWRFQTLDCLPRAALATLAESLFALAAASPTPPRPFSPRP